MHMKRSIRFSFNRRSLALFASLAMGSGLAAAQFTVGPGGPIASPGKAPTQASDKFAKLDTDGNGSISRKEASAAGRLFVGNFDTLDTNRDGMLSRAEFEAASK